MLLHLIIGACYRWSMINTFMSSYFKLTNDPYISIAQDSFGTPLYIFSVGLTMKPALKLSEKTGKLILIPFAVIMVAVSILIASMMPSFLCTSSLIKYSYCSITSSLGCRLGSYSSPQCPNAKNTSVNIDFTSIVLS